MLIKVTYIVEQSLDSECISNNKLLDLGNLFLKFE